MTACLGCEERRVIMRGAYEALRKGDFQTFKRMTDEVLQSAKDEFLRSRNRDTNVSN